MPQFVLDLPAMTAAAVKSNQILIASGTILTRYDVTRLESERIELPPTLNHPITSIAIDEESWWLGTEGEGLVRIYRSGKPPQVFDEKQGLLMPCIRASYLSADRLWLGFGFHGSGGFGYLDIATGKFVGLTAEAALFKSRQETLQGPPDSEIGAITANKSVLWVSSVGALHRFDTASQQWHLALPVGPRAVSVSSNYVAAASPTGGVLVCKLPANQWQQIDVGTKRIDNTVLSLRMDDQRLWVGGIEAIRLIDLTSLSVIGERKFIHRNVRWMARAKQGVWLVADGPAGQHSSLYWLMKPPAQQALAPSTARYPASEQAAEIQKAN